MSHEGRFRLSGMRAGVGNSRKWIAGFDRDQHRALLGMAMVAG
jgi:hypothetical protein